MDSISDLEYDLKFSINYHRKREFFYRAVDGSSKAVSLIALASIGFDANSFTVVTAILSGLFTISTIVLDCSGMASRHGSLAARYSGLLSKTAFAKSGEGELCVLRQEYHVIEADEPPSLRGLVQLCQDEQDAAEGKTVNQDCFSFRRRMAAHLGFGQRSIDCKPTGANA